VIAGTNTIDVSNLASGVYVMQLGLSAQKLIVR